MAFYFHILTTFHGQNHIKTAVCSRVFVFVQWISIFLQRILKTYYVFCDLQMCFVAQMCVPVVSLWSFHVWWYVNTNTPTVSL